MHAEVARTIGAGAGDLTAEEVLGNIEAMTYAVGTLAAEGVTVPGLLEAHRLLLRGTRLSDHGGKIRVVQNWIGGGSHNPCRAAFVPPPPELVQPLLDDLCDFCERDDLPPLAQAAVAHAQFESRPEITLHLGHFLSHPTRLPLAHPQAGGPRTAEVIKTEEKGSDVNLATYLLLDAFRADFEAAAVITNDSDLKERIRIVRAELNLPVGIVNPHPASRRSRALTGTFFKQLRPSVLATCQLPETVADANGSIRKPQGW